MFQTAWNRYSLGSIIMCLYQHFKIRPALECHHRTLTLRQISWRETQEPVWMGKELRRWWKLCVGRESSECQNHWRWKYTNCSLPCSFDQARLIRHNRILASNGIDPSGEVLLLLLSCYIYSFCVRYALGFQGNHASVNVPVLSDFSDIFHFMRCPSLTSEHLSLLHSVHLAVI